MGAETALLGEPVVKLKITRQTLEFAEKKMVRGGLMNFMSKFLGSKNDQEDFEQTVADNAYAHRKEHEEAISRTQSKYSKCKRQTTCPSADAIYGVSGGTGNKDFANALVSERIKRQVAASDKKEMDDELMGESREKELLPNNIRFPNAVIKKMAVPRWMPSVHRKGPLPCLITSNRSFGTRHRRINVRCAKDSYGVDYEVLVNVHDLILDLAEIKKYERAFLKTWHGGHYGLGYTSIDEHEAREREHEQMEVDLDEYEDDDITQSVGDKKGQSDGEKGNTIFNMCVTRSIDVQKYGGKWVAVGKGVPAQITLRGKSCDMRFAYIRQHGFLDATASVSFVRDNFSKDKKVVKKAEERHTSVHGSLGYPHL